MTAQKPVRSEGGAHDDYVESHPAYGLIGASRVSSTPGAVLADSDFRHQHFITIRVHAAQLRRSLSGDWWGTTVEPMILEVAMSYAQWATFISTPNVGEGVPCTIEYRDGKKIPDITFTADRTGQFRGEVEDHLKDATERIDRMLAEWKLTRQQRIDLQVLRSQIGGNIDYVAKRFDEHAEKTVERMKVEVAAYTQMAIERAGLAALGGGPLLELVEGDDDG